MYTYHTRVVASCTDETRTQTLLSTVTMMQDCSILSLESEPTLSAWLDDADAAMMVASREVEIRRRPRFGERLAVRTWIYRMQSLMGYRNTCVFDEDGEAVAACWAVGVFYGFDERRALKVPERVVDSIDLQPAFDMAYGKRKIKLPDRVPRRLDPCTAQRSDIDLNGHVNNAQYVRMAFERLPHDFEPTHMRITHDGQAKRGQTIHRTLYETKDAYTFVLSGDADQTFAVVEFS